MTAALSLALIRCMYSACPMCCRTAPAEADRTVTIKTLLPP